MAGPDVGQAWETYSSNERRWVRVIVAKIDGDQITLRYEGTLELLTVSVDELENNPERFRVVVD